MTGGSSRFSLAGFAVALVTVGVGTAAGLEFVPVVGTSVGAFAGAFVAGLATETRPTVESGVAAALAGLGVLLAATLPGNGVVEAVLALGSVSPVTLFVSVALSFAVGALGGHFGDDVRDGLTEPLAESGPRPTAGGGAPGTRTTAAESADAELTQTDSTAAETDDPEPPAADREQAGSVDADSGESGSVDADSGESGSVDEETEFELE